jgi:hypothetical protein
MAIIQSGAVPTSLLTVDPTFAAIRTSDHPPEIVGSYQIGLTTGSIGTVGANSTIVSWRWVPTNTSLLCMIRRVEVGVVITSAVTTAQYMTVAMTRASSWSIADTVGTGGTTVSMTANNNKSNSLRTSMVASSLTSGSILVAGTAVNTAGTRTLDSYPLGYVTGNTTSTVGATVIPMTPIFQHQPGDYPLIMSSSSSSTAEGFVINNINALASGNAQFIINVEWMELNATTGNVIAY